MADDSGLSIKILSNQPGVLSSRWAVNKNYSAVFKLIRSKIREKGEDMEKQPAFFNCTLAFMQSPIKVYIFEGILEGRLTYPPKGNSGFGYDPIFIPNGIKKTLAELKTSEKNRISHRKVAIQKLIEFLIER